MSLVNLYDQQSSNVRRTWALMAVFLIVVIALGFAISWYFNSSALLYAAVAFALLMNIGSYWYSDKLVLSMTKARPASREEFFDFYTVAENMAITAGLPMPKLFVIDDPAPNAFATGRDAKHAVVVATTGLLAMMTRSELEGVVAHEMSHIKNRDILLMTVAVVLAGFVAIIANLFLRVSFWGGGRRNNSEGGTLIAVVAILAAVLAPVAAQLIQLAVSRKREFLADASGALLTRYPEGLASALEKIGAYRTPMQNANPATAHLFISNPFGARASESTGWHRLFMTHPPIEDRIHALLGT